VRALIASRRSRVTTRDAPPLVASRLSTRCSWATSRARTHSSASTSPVTLSAEMTSGIVAIASRSRLSAAASCRASVAVSGC